MNGQPRRVKLVPLSPASVHHYEDAAMFYGYVGETELVYLAQVCSTRTGSPISHIVYAVDKSQFRLASDDSSDLI